jgi:hypothetical protein
MALAIGMTKSGLGIAGSALFVEGMSSMADPMFISDRSVRNAANVINRGGVVRTRPGFNTIFTLPDGELQGLWYFRPLASEAFLVFAVAGTVYQTSYPFTSYAAITGLSFFPYAKEMFAESAVQSARTMSDGSVISVEPTRVLILQDGGYTRAGYWDGAIAKHLDPSAQATAESTLSGDGVLSVKVTYGGTGYTAAPRVIFDVPSLPGHRATGTAVLVGDAVDSVIVTDSGSGYDAAPIVAFTDPSVDSTDPTFGTSTKYQTPLGGPMVWSGDRLWVAQNNKLFASDISNPISFFENQYAASGGFFEFTERITALAEAPSPSNPFVAIFTDTSTSAIQSSIRSRDSWKLTPGFQNTIFPGVGCTSQRSVVKPLGELWWMSPFGLISFNSAARASQTSKLVPQDTKMLVSKSNLSPDLSTVAAGTYENFILTSVPYSDKYNQHTWAYDQAAQSDDATAGSMPSWAGVWTGVRPVQWATGMFDSVQRAFFISKDYDGKNRLWEAFVSERSDNAQRISCFVETKVHNDFSLPQVTGLDRKQFVFAEVTLCDVQGPVDLKVSWAGTRGKYKEIGTWTLQSDEGSLVAAVPFTSVSSYLAQNRVLRTREVVKDANATCNSLTIESKLSDWVDVGFSLLIEWSGKAALKSYRIFANPYEEPATGDKGFVETSPRVIAGTSCP